MIAPRAWHWPAAVALLLFVALAGLVFGVSTIPLSEIFAAITGGGDETTTTIVRTLRAPRVALAAMVGAALAMSGAALQGALRNSLAEPYLLGVSGGAAVGAVLAFGLGLQHTGSLAIPAFVGAIVAVGAALLVARAAGRAARGDPRTLLMAGVIIGAFANAVIMVALANSTSDTLRGSLWWMMGSVADASWAGALWLGLYLGVAGLALLRLAPEIDVLALGEEAAAALGSDVERATRTVFLVSALLAAATVAAAGLIGFVGLIVPHIVRAFGVRRHRRLIAGSAIVGGILVILADVVARTALPPAELPLGAVTALIGVPFFLVRLGRMR
ncbi:MAG: iron ABC transporter permease [Gemmatimonadaceae bacterium]|nr:iron ABC transporter permease [Gemmatimonadaceae bacterium]